MIINIILVSYLIYLTRANMNALDYVEMEINDLKDSVELSDTHTLKTFDKCESISGQLQRALDETRYLLLRKSAN